MRRIWILGERSSGIVVLLLVITAVCIARAMSHPVLSRKFDVAGCHSARFCRLGRHCRTSYYALLYHWTLAYKRTNQGFAQLHQFSKILERKAQVTVGLDDYYYCSCRLIYSSYF